MLRLSPLLVAALVLGACATPPEAPGPTRAPDFRAAEIRQAALVLRVVFSRGDFAEDERTSLPREYEAALLEGLNARAVPVRDLRTVGDPGPSPVPAAAVARAREVGADHAVIVELTLARGMAEYCGQTRRPFRLPTTVWRQEIQVLRAADGAARLTVRDSPTLAVTDIEPDCEDPRGSRRRAPAESAADAVERLLARLLER